MILSYFQLTLGLIFLIFGGHFLVKGTHRLSILLNSRVFFVSLFILGMGTSAPELFVTLQSHLNSEPDLAISNIIGSNIFNILIVASIVILGNFILKDRQYVFKNTLLLLFSTLLLVPLLWDHSLSRIDGIILIGLFSLFIAKPSYTNQKLKILDIKKKAFLSITGFLILGFTLLFIGSNLTINSSIILGNSLGISKRIIGLFILSIGTSLPELIIGLISLVKKNSEIALGSLVGSNAFNTFFIPGIAAMISPLPIARQLIIIDGTVVVVSTLVLALLIFSFKKVPRWIGFFLILGYILYAQMVLMNRI